MAQSDEGAGALLGLAVLGGIAFFVFAPDSWSNAVWYGIKYQINPGNVQTDTKPSDCNFTRAPFGDKACSYKAHVEAYNAKGALVGGDGAPKFGHDAKAGSPIVSYDDGKTWQWYSGEIPDPKVTSVHVFWHKESTE